MQELRLVAVSEDGTYLVLATAGRGTRFTLPVDDRLRAAVRGHFSRLGQFEIEVESPLRPKEIQARIRSGETAEEIAESAGIPVERVRWFEGPVLQEREYMAQQAQRVAVRRPGDSTPGPPLGETVEERLGRSGVDLEEVEWDSWKCEDNTWRVRLSFFENGRPHAAEWVFDPRRRHVSPLDEVAARLSAVDWDEDDDSLGDTVTPLMPRRPAMKVVSDVRDLGLGPAPVPGPLPGPARGLPAGYDAPGERGAGRPGGPPLRAAPAPSEPRTARRDRVADGGRIAEPPRPQPLPAPEPSAPESGEAAEASVPAPRDEQAAASAPAAPAEEAAREPRREDGAAPQEAREDAAAESKARPDAEPAATPGKPEAAGTKDEPAEADTADTAAGESGETAPTGDGDATESGQAAQGAEQAPQREEPAAAKADAPDAGTTADDAPHADHRNDTPKSEPDAPAGPERPAAAAGEPQAEAPAAEPAPAAAAPQEPAQPAASATAPQAPQPQHPAAHQPARPGGKKKSAGRTAMPAAQVDKPGAGAAAGDAPAPQRPARSRRRAKGKRASVPSWDEIMFGARRPD